jgi:ATP-dependent helicase HrpB
MTRLPLLPITPILLELLSVIQSHPNVILQAEPGAGKSTAVPLALLTAEFLANQTILMLEPRRLTVRSIARFLAKQRCEAVGESVGYQIRNERRVSANTRLEIITEGILTRRLQQDPELTGVGLIIFDEFHERSIHADLALSLCLEVQQSLRADLKILIMSATLNSENLSAFLQQAPVVRAEGRSFPVQIQYHPHKLLTVNDSLNALTACVKNALQRARKDLLVFLPGQAEIKRAQRLLTENLPNNLRVLPLYGGLSNEDQDAALQPDPNGQRKIILATNIAETGLTIDNLDAVIDTGWTRKAIYDISSGMTRLVTQRISLASAQQRRGRAGRLTEGFAFRLWSEEQHHQLATYDTEEILQTDLSDLVLELAQWGASSADELRWLTPPPTNHYQSARRLLQQLDLLTHEGRLTAIGKEASGLGLHPRLAKMLLLQRNQPAEQQSLACDLAALLTEGDILLQTADADILKRLLALQAYRQQPARAQREYAIRSAKAENALKNIQAWRKQLVFSAGLQLNLTQLSELTGRLVMLAYPDRIAQRRKGTEPRYLLSNGKGAQLRADDPLRDSAWLAIADIDGQRQEGRIYLAAPLDICQIQQELAHQIVTQTQLDYDAKKNQLTAVEQRKLGKLILSEQPQAGLQSSEYETALLKLLSERLDLLPWNESAQALLSRLRWLAQLNADWPSYQPSWLAENLDQWLAPYLTGIQSIKTLQQLNLTNILLNGLDYAQQQELEQQAPRDYRAPSGKRVKIDYTQPKQAKVSIVLQELFGELSSPRFGWQQVPLTFELLSPAQRPIQTTSDLAGFWQTSYYEVIKEMKGRYPRHRWPDKPLEEKPGRSIQPRQ